MQKNPGLRTKPTLRIVGSIVAVSCLGACVQIVGMDDPTLVDHLDQSTGSSGVGGQSSTSSSSSTASSASSASSSSASSSSSSSSSSSGSGSTHVWAEWPMPNPPSTMLPNPANYSPLDLYVTDLVTNLVWQRQVSPATATWTEAQAYCDGLVLGPYSDWRLPSRIELVSLIDYTKNSPAIDSAAFPATPAAAFWTNSPAVTAIGKSAWSIDFTTGSTSTANVTVAQQVRCVR